MTETLAERRARVDAKYTPERLHSRVVTCCRCLKRPVRFVGGHVTRGDELLYAGWCTECREDMDNACCARFRHLARTWTIEEFMACDWTGWYGHWVEAMGEAPDPFPFDGLTAKEK